MSAPLAPHPVNGTPRLTMRLYRGDEDFWRVRNLLTTTYPLVPTDFNWEIRRWDGKRFYEEDLTHDRLMKFPIALWETDEAELVGVAHVESQLGESFFEIHPDYRFVEEEMIAWTEANHAAPDQETGARTLHINVYEYDAPRRLILERRGYEKQSYGGMTRRMRFGKRPLPAVEMARPYTLRHLRERSMEDAQGIADLLNAAFGRTFHNGREFLNFAATAPCFRHDLHLVAEAPDGSFAAHVGVIFDDVNRYGIFEPVCTHPDHRRHGLSRALMIEGMHRARALGATDMIVGTGDDPVANQFYDSLGFTEAYKSYVWRKVLA